MNSKAKASLTCSTREASLALGISVRTAQLWVEDGRLQAWKTPGGHRRILRTSVDRLIEQQQVAAHGNAAELSILILDGDLAEREALRAKLLAHFPGVQVLLSAHAFEGLLKIGEQVPDVLITDLDLVGIGNLRRLDTVDPGPQLRSMLVIVRSADEAMLQEAEKRLPPEFSLFRKQECCEELLRLIHAYLQGRQTNWRHS